MMVQMSMIPFVQSEIMKDELNRVFQKTYPKISKSISLSKIRRLKQDLVNLFLKSDNPVTDLTTSLVYPNLQPRPCLGAV